MPTYQASETAELIRTRDKDFVWHPWSPIDAPGQRVMADRASGLRLWDVDGVEYLDASSLNAIVGYAHPAIVAAAAEQLARLHGLDISVQDHIPVGRLAERLAGFLSGGLTRTLFTNSGSEGIEASAVIAVGYWANVGQPRTRIVSFARGYHGSTILARSLSGLPPTSHPFAPPLIVSHVDLPVADRKVREPETLALLLSAFDDAIGDDPGDLPMAVLVEPLINVGGGIVLPPGFLTELRALCDARGVLLILDEVFTGIGRTGAMFGFQHDGIEPDIVVSSKGLSGGYAPIAAVTVQERIYETFRDDPVIGGLRYGHTTSGHPVACATALATLDVVERQHLVKRSRTLGAQLLEQLQPLEQRPPVVDVRGLGLLVVFEMATPEQASALLDAAQRQRLLLRQQGRAVMVVPPLNIDSADLDEITARVTAAVDEVNG